MIELPETYILKNQIQRTLVGKKIVRVQANTYPHKFAWYSGDPQEYPAMLEGKEITSVGGRVGFACGGSCVIILCEDTLLIINTPIKYHDAGEKLPAKHQLLLEFDDTTYMSCTVQMWGGMFCVPAEDGSIPEDRAVSPLSNIFDESYFEKLRCSVKPELSVKGFLSGKRLLR